MKIRGGCGKYQTFKLVKSDTPDALVFQSVRKGAPMRDNNVLSRHIKPAARKLGIPWVNWRCLRTSFATMLKEKGVHVRDAQALMRHSRASTTLDIYQQTTDAQQRAALSRLVERRRPLRPVSNAASRVGARGKRTARIKRQVVYFGEDSSHRRSQSHKIARWPFRCYIQTVYGNEAAISLRQPGGGTRTPSHRALAPRAGRAHRRVVADNPGVTGKPSSAERLQCRRCRL